MKRKILKKRLFKLKQHRSRLPRLIECSEVYGDRFYTDNDLILVNEEIKKIEKYPKDTKDED